MGDSATRRAEAKAKDRGAGGASTVQRARWSGGEGEGGAGKRGSNGRPQNHGDYYQQKIGAKRKRRREEGKEKSSALMGHSEEQLHQPVRRSAVCGAGQAGSRGPHAWQHRMCQSRNTPCLLLFLRCLWPRLCDSYCFGPFK